MNKYIFSAILLTTACGGVADPTSTDGQNSSDPSETVRRPPENSPAAARISVSGFAHGTNGSPLEDVDVCLMAGPLTDMPVQPCASSASDGSFTVDGIPANMQLTLAFQKEGFAPAIRAIETGAEDVTLPSGENQLVRLSPARTFMGVPVDTGLGQIEFFATDDGSAVSVELVGISGSRADPIYLNATGNPVVGAKSGMRGGFTNLSGGLYALTFSSPSADCELSDGNYGYPFYVNPDSRPGVAGVAVPVLAGFVTTPVRVSCKAAPQPATATN